jgi:hypothetical protein
MRGVTLTTRYYEGEMADGQFHGQGTLYFPGPLPDLQLQS